MKINAQKLFLCGGHTYLNFKIYYDATVIKHAHTHISWTKRDDGIVFCV